MFEHNIRFQLAALCCYAVIVVDYIRGKKTNLAASKWFNLMLVLTGLYLVFDISTVYTITYIPTSFINRLCHQLFIGCLDTLIFSLWVYVEMIGHRFTNMKKPVIVMCIAPYVISMMTVIFGKLEYHIDTAGGVCYSYGQMVYTVYVSVFIYMALVAFRSFGYKDVIPAKKCAALRIGAVMWLVFCLVQLIIPRMLVSGLGVVLVILLLYLSFENTGENEDPATGTYNNKVFDAVVSERLKYSPEITIVVLTVLNINQLVNNVRKEGSDSVLADCCRYMTDLFHSDCYRVNDNTFAVVMEHSGNSTEIKPSSIASYTSKEQHIHKELEESPIGNKLFILENRIDEPWEYANNNVKISATIDVIECPEFASTLDEMYSLMRYMQRGHSKSGCNVQITDEYIGKEKKRYDTVKRIVEDAVENDGFEVYYQPIYSTKKHKFISAEALVRLKDTTTVGYVSPEEFVPICEKNGRILELGSDVFEKVCRFARSAKLADLGIEYIEVNLSGIQASDLRLPEHLKSIADKYGISPSFINLEITETASVDSGEMLKINMDKLRNDGFSFSMDDFGTGYSNLSQMAEISYDLVKLDKSLIWPCFGENASVKSICILETVVVMLRALGVHIVAEGVETDEMAKKLEEYKVDYLQGYNYSRPICESDFIKFLSNMNSAERV